MAEYTTIEPESTVTLRGFAPCMGWLHTVRVEFEGRSPPRWLVRVQGLVADGTPIFARGPTDSVGLSMFEGAGFKLTREMAVVSGAPVELVVQNPGRVPLRLRVVPIVRPPNTAVLDPVAQHFRRWT